MKKKPILNDYAVCEWRLHELGLGRGVDGTSPLPWINKGTFTVREAKVQTATDDEDDEEVATTSSNMISTDEGGMQQHFVQEVTSIKQQSINLDVSVVVPNTPVNIAVGAELCRSLTKTQKAIGERVLNKTLAFKAVVANDESEVYLAKHVLEFAKQQNKAESVKTLAGMDSSSIQQAFKDFIEHYRITHYVSSVTLGASRFTVQTETEYHKTITPKGGGGFDSVAQASASFTYETKSKKLTQNVQCIGRLEEDGTVSKEAVVEVKLESILSLVTTEKIIEPLKNALREYTREQHERKGTTLCKNMYCTVQLNVELVL